MNAILPFATPTAVPKFHFSFWVQDLARSVRFYEALFGSSPQKNYDDYAKFELSNPPIAVSLLPQPAPQGRSLNHVGIRMPDAKSLVAVQRRLEHSGYQTIREDGVECCYALQTKFWVNDPDGVPWEIYTLHEDIGHHGKSPIPELSLDQSLTSSMTLDTTNARASHERLDVVTSTGESPKRSVTESTPAQTAVQLKQEFAPRESELESASLSWTHNQPDPISLPIARDSGSVEHVQLFASFNARGGMTGFSNLVTEVFRVLKPGGTVFLRGLVGDKLYPGVPNFPGLSAKYQFIPQLHEAMDCLEQVGFRDVVVETWKEVDCIRDSTDVQFAITTMTARKPN